MVEVTHTWTESPVGTLLLVADAGELRAISFERDGAPAEPPAGSARHQEGFSEAIAQLRAYFARELQTFDLPLGPRGTPFQMRVWQELRSIPYGETRSYSQIARAIGRPDSVRAVGSANGANPLPIVVPCHRVIGASGSLTGFGGGIRAKRLLLDLQSTPPLF